MTPNFWEVPRIVFVKKNKNRLFTFNCWEAANKREEIPPGAGTAEISAGSQQKHPHPKSLSWPPHSRGNTPGNSSLGIPHGRTPTETSTSQIPFLASPLQREQSTWEFLSGNSSRECAAEIRDPLAFPWLCSSSHPPRYFRWIANPGSALPTEEQHLKIKLIENLNKQMLFFFSHKAADPNRRTF